VCSSKKGPVGGGYKSTGNVIVFVVFGLKKTLG